MVSIAENKATARKECGQDARKKAETAQKDLKNIKLIKKPA